MEAGAAATPLGTGLNRLVNIIDTLTGAKESPGRPPCPWTADNSPAALLDYVKDETDEVAAELRAIDREAEAGVGVDGAAVRTPEQREASLARLESELGDLAFCALFSTALAARDYGARPERVWAGIAEKLEGRCAYLFDGAAAPAATLREASACWQRAKAAEKRRDAAAQVAACARALELAHPWATAVLQRRKTVETREYALPDELVGTEIALVESYCPADALNRAREAAGVEGFTEGEHSSGVTAAVVVGIAIFGPSKRYTSEEEWAAEADKHLVPRGDARFGWSDDREKWGWPVRYVRALPRPQPPPGGMTREFRSIFRLTAGAGGAGAEQRIA